MRFLKLALLAVICFGSALKAEDAPNPATTDAPKAAEAKPDEAPKAEPAKPADNGELPNAPVGAAPLSVALTESLVGDISKVAAPEKGKAKKKAKKGGAPDTGSIVLTVSAAGKEGKKAKKEGKAAKTAKTITLNASGEVFTKLTELAEKHAHVKVTGELNGTAMSVKEVAEAPAEEPKAKKKKKNNV